MATAKMGLRDRINERFESFAKRHGGRVVDGRVQFDTPSQYWKTRRLHDFMIMMSSLRLGLYKREQLTTAGGLTKSVMKEKKDEWNKNVDSSLEQLTAKLRGNKPATKKPPAEKKAPKKKAPKKKAPPKKKGQS